MAEIRDRVREEIEEINRKPPRKENCEHTSHDTSPICEICRANQILSIKLDDRYELAVVDRKAELPEYRPNPIWARVSFQDVQQDMLKTNWVQEVK